MIEDPRNRIQAAISQRSAEAVNAFLSATGATPTTNEGVESYTLGNGVLVEVSRRDNSIARAHISVKGAAIPGDPISGQELDLVTPTEVGGSGYALFRRTFAASGQQTAQGPAAVAELNRLLRAAKLRLAPGRRI